jgi:hypothetical protein
MESLVYFVLIIFAVALFLPILAFLLTLIHPKTKIIIIIKRIIQAIFIAISLAFALQFTLVNPPNLLPLGVYAIIISYISLRREYFPHIKILRPLLKKIAIRKK